MQTETRKYIMHNQGMPVWTMAGIDALLPILPGNPEDYVTQEGRLMPDVVKKGTRPHSHSTGYAADLILSLWTGTSPIFRLATHSGTTNRKILARALRVMATALDY